MGLVEQWRWLVIFAHWSELSTAKTELQPCVVISNPSSNVFSRGSHVKRTGCRSTISFSVIYVDFLSNIESLILDK